MDDDIDVLVVEDDDDLRTSWREILRDAGWQVEEACDGLTALEFLRSIPIGAVVLDISLPLLDGFGLLDQLERPPPVLLVTGHIYDSEVMERRDKVLFYLQKPVQPPELLWAVARAIATGQS
ncbi:MAG TPA: response regulator [Acidimicrobiales bacterium]|nr:response regulator [Acidimicrobiales bacterium]